MKTRHYRELVIWQRGMLIARHIYQVSKSFPKDELYGLTSQIRRAAISIPSNIAEGHGRTTDKSFAQFVAQARGSLYEAQTQAQLAADLGYVAVGDWRTLDAEIEELTRMMNAFLRVLNKEGPE
jgi:four helix bundle protein